MGKSDSRRIVIDLGFEECMNDKELSHLASQLRRIYGSNKRHYKSPAHLIFTGLIPGSKSHVTFCQKNEGFSNYQVSMTDRKLMDYFSSEEDKTNLVYLSPDAEQTLQCLDENKIYVLGGLVDDSVKKNTTVEFSKKHGIQTGKLPIAEHMARRRTKSEEKGKTPSFKQILSLNQVFDILMKYFETQDWGKALSVGVPQRTGFKAENINS